MVSKQSSYTSSNPYKIVEGMEVYDQLQKNLEDVLDISLLRLTKLLPKEKIGH